MNKLNSDTSILIIDDEELISWAVARDLQREGFRAVVANTGEAGLEIAAQIKPDVVLLDFKLPRCDGLEVLEKIKAKDPYCIIIFMTAYGSHDNALKAMKLGAYKYVNKPVDVAEIMLLISRAMEEKKLRKEVVELRRTLKRDFGFSTIIGNTPVIRQMLETVRKVAASPAASVLVQGDSGTGKELIANAIHDQSSRRSGQLVGVNCGALPPNLLESELFGFEKGAFTDAKRMKQGQFELANGGTIILDEIGEMDPAMQVKLLRLLENRSFRRLGGERDHNLDVRVIAITNQNLEQMIREGRFRSDLYFRLNLINIHVPSLAERKEDIHVLASYFIDNFNRQFKKHFQGIDSQSMATLEDWPWPGNVRELRNVIERAMLLEDGPMICMEHLPQEMVRPRVTPSNCRSLLSDLPEEGFPLEEMERQMICMALERANGNQSKASRLLSVSRDTFRYKMKKFGMLDDPSGSAI